MRHGRLFLFISLAVFLVTSSFGAAQAPARNVVIVTIDGLRWQEFFGGAQRDYFKKEKDGTGGAPERRFWRESEAERRALLMPFLWEVVAKNGQILGDQSKQSLVRLTNGLWFSYPGYNEIFAGVADKRIDSNDKNPNPNVTVLEWLNSRPGFQGRVAAFGAWDVLPSILNVGRSKLPVGTGFTPVPSPATDRDREINQLASDLPRYWNYGTLDAPVLYAVLESLRRDKPRVLYLMLGEGDEFAHEGRYDLYLDASQRADRFIQRIWDTLQSLPDYARNTALIITTDHGRGDTTTDWKDHGRDVPAAERTWIAVLGPGIAPLGVRSGVNATTSQIAATIASLVGEDFRQAVPAAAPPISLR